MAPHENGGAADSSNRPRGFGRKKIPIQKIENKQALKVTFSKRRQGLFKKASVLSVLCGVPVAVITFSPAGNPFSFGSPSVDAVLGRYLNPATASTTDVAAIQQQRLNQLQGSSSTSSNYKGKGKGKAIGEMGLEELQGLQESLVELRNRMAVRADELWAERCMALDGGAGGDGGDDDGLWLDNYLADHSMDD